MTAEELQEAQLELEKRRVALDEERVRGEQASTRRLIPIILPIAGTLIAAIITTGATMISNKAQSEETARSKEAQSEETERARIAAERQQSVANGQAAASMYFQSLADLRGKDVLSAGEKKRFARDLEIVAAISANDDLKPILLKVSREAAGTERDEAAQRSAQQGGATAGPSTALQGLPDLSPAKVAKAYTAADFLAYPQVPSTRWKNDTQPFRENLSNLGFGTQAAEQMRSNRAPAKNQVRYYKPEHEKLATETAVKLSRAMRQRFEVRRVGGGATLPNGVMEFWLGTNPDPV